MSVVILLEAVLETFKTETQSTVDTHISSFLKHAPEKPGCPRDKVNFEVYYISSISCFYLCKLIECVAFNLSYEGDGILLYICTRKQYPVHNDLRSCVNL